MELVSADGYMTPDFGLALLRPVGPCPGAPAEGEPAGTLHSTAANDGSRLAHVLEQLPVLLGGCR